MWVSCDTSTEVCVNEEGGYQCACTTGYYFDQFLLACLRKYSNFILYCILYVSIISYCIVMHVHVSIHVYTCNTCMYQYFIVYITRMYQYVLYNLCINNVLYIIAS